MSVNFRTSFVGPVSTAGLVLAALLGAVPVLSKPQQSPYAAPAEPGLPAAQGTGASSSPQSSEPQSPASIRGTIIGPGGAVLVGVRVTLALEAPSPGQEVLSADDGQFSFAGLPPGPFQLTISSTGFAPKTLSGTLHPGEASILPPIELALASPVTEVSVTMSRVEVAEAEIKAEEKQRALGIIPNFYVSYVPNAAPLTSKQKFELAWRSTIDPITFVIVGGIAGVEQAQNSFKGYGQGGQGYGKRYGAVFADTVTSSFIGGYLFPSILKQDPRYFYKGTGSRRYRLLYALANAVICKSDRGRWQANYSGIMGSLASGGISNLYYPSGDRGASLVFENTLIGIGSSAIANVFQEFVVRKFTPKLPKRVPSVP